jgi:potassium/hydrogen antiporter
LTGYSSTTKNSAITGLVLMLGLLVFPHQWSGVWLEGTLVFLGLTFISRPITVFVGTAFMNLGWRKISNAILGAFQSPVGSDAGQSA